MCHSYKPSAEIKLLEAGWLAFTVIITLKAVTHKGTCTDIFIALIVSLIEIMHHMHVTLIFKITSL